MMLVRRLMAFVTHKALFISLLIFLVKIFGILSCMKLVTLVTAELVFCKLMLRIIFMKFFMTLSLLLLLKILI